MEQTLKFQLPTETKAILDAIQMRIRAIRVEFETRLDELESFQADVALDAAKRLGVDTSRRFAYDSQLGCIVYADEMADETAEE